MDMQFSDMQFSVLGNEVLRLLGRVQFDRNHISHVGATMRPYGLHLLQEASRRFGGMPPLQSVSDQHIYFVGKTKRRTHLHGIQYCF